MKNSCKRLRQVELTNIGNTFSCKKAIHRVRIRQTNLKILSRIWSKEGLESISNNGALIQLSELSNKVVLKASVQTSTQKGIKFVKRSLLFEEQNIVLGVNGDKIEAYPNEEGTHIWKAEQVTSDAAETNFAKITLDSKPISGVWPFDCENTIPCRDFPMQTCGCDDSSKYSGHEKRGIVYNMDADSKMADSINFQTCEELKYHGVSIPGYFMINGIKTYCSSWSKFFNTQLRIFPL